MKALKNLVITSAVAASLAGSALGNTKVIVHVVGAPAFRQPVNDAIETVVESFGSSAGLTATSATGTIPASGSRTTGSIVESAKQNQWLIPNFESGTDLEINASFTGSTAGVESVASQTVTQKFIADGTGTVATPQNTTTTVAIAPDPNWITASDTFQATTLFNGSQTFYGAARNGSAFTYNYESLTADLGGTPGGVEVYHWVVGPGAPSTFTNINRAQAQQLYSQGYLPLSYFTGNSADESTIVYALSRDPGSGARTIALAEIGVQPPGTNASINSYVPTITTGSGSIDNQGSVVGGTITANAQAPAGTIPSTGIYEPAGDTGYASFGTALNGGTTADSSSSSSNVGLLQAITANPPAKALFITYLDNDDTNEAVAASTGAKVLTYNGVSASLTRGVDTAVAEGNYTFWSYESFLAPSGQSSTAEDFENQVETDFPVFAALEYAYLNVKRTVDGGTISPIYAVSHN